ncbi:hypothetical protein SS50377_23684 [Spironucleus salmonicida]|uniref:Uncharacterized protein n=1 Tax=Spironucleus salmonicida TaxID=348837 RepID=A0A9P8LSH9_9EUKA|nr:hypothetical protein SS50377_23684 [Spironucleus salmonicida]
MSKKRAAGSKTKKQAQKILFDANLPIQFISTSNQQVKGNKHFAVIISKNISKTLKKRLE